MPQVGDISVKVLASLDDASLKPKIDDIQARIDELTKSRNINLQMDAAKLKTQLATIDRDIAKTTGDKKLKFDADTALAAAKIDELSVGAEKASELKNLKIDADIAGALAKLDELDIAADKAAGTKKLKIEADTAVTMAKLAELGLDADEVARRREMAIDVKDDSTSKIAKVLGLIKDIPLGIEKAIPGVTKLGGKFLGLGNTADKALSSAESDLEEAGSAASEGSKGVEVFGMSLAKLGWGAAAAIPALGALLVEADGLVSGLTAAGIGVVAFGALAYPTFEKVYQAMGDSKAQLEKLPAAERNVVEGIQGLKSEIEKLQNQQWVKADAFSIMNSGLGTAKNLLGDVNEFAKPAGAALEKIAEDIKTITGSPAFQQWAAKLSSYVGPALNAIAVGVEHVGGNFGKLFTIMSKKDVVNAINIAFSILDGTIIALDWTIQTVMQRFDHVTHQIDDFRATMVHAGEAVNSDFLRPVTAGIEAFVNFINDHFWDPVNSIFTSDVPHAFSSGWDSYQKNFLNPMRGGISDFINAINSDFWRPLDTFFTSDVPHAFSSGWDSYQNDFLNPMKGGISDLIGVVSSDFWNPLNTFFTSDIPRAFEDGYSAFGKYFVNPLRNAIAGVVSFIMSDLVKPVEEVFGTDLPKTFAAGVAAAGRAWSGIENAIEKPVQFVVNDVYDDGIVKFWNSVGPKVGLGRLSPIHLASGGHVHGGGNGTSDSIPAMLSAGEFVVNARSTSKHRSTLEAINNESVAHFSGGGLVGGIESALSGAGKWVTDIMSGGAASLIKSVLGPIENAIPSGQSQLSQIPKDAVKAVVNGIVQAVSGAGSAAGGSAANVSSAGEMANAKTIFNYLTHNGMTAIAAAGAIASLVGESSLNPEAIEAGGGGGEGIAQWTGSSQSAAMGFSRLTGNASRDLSAQLPGLIKLANASDPGAIAAMNKATSVLQAANIWGRDVERYGVNDVHAAGLSIGNMLLASAGGSNKPHSTGGVISEPVYGVGKFSGQSYSFAERGPETVLSASQSLVDASGDPIARAQMNKLLDLVQQGNQIMSRQPREAAKFQRNANAAARVWG